YGGPAMQDSADGQNKLKHGNRGRGLLVAGIAAATMALSPSASEAALLVYEGFNYEPGALSNADGGTGWKGAWGVDAANQVVAGSLSYGSLQTTGGSFSRSSTANTRSFREFENTIGNSTGEIWISFLIDSGDTFLGAQINHAVVAS